MSGRFGAHVSIAGGVEKAPQRGKDVGCDIIQIFTKNSHQWAVPPIEEAQALVFRKQIRALGLLPSVAHTCYLINLASSTRTTRRRSRETLLIELKRAHQLRIPCLVFHPGAHTGSGERVGLQRIIEACNHILMVFSGTTELVFETTAGQGTYLGYCLEHLAQILEGIEQQDRIGFCLDTCHLFAAGYDISTQVSYDRTTTAFDEAIGLDRIRVIHANDSREPRGSRIDRHEHIGAGCIGLEGFRSLVNDPRLAAVPLILETPKGVGGDMDRRNLATLRSLVE